jgi:hypothetical protein
MVKNRLLLPGELCFLRFPLTSGKSSNRPAVVRHEQRQEPGHSAKMQLRQDHSASQKMLAIIRRGNA